MDAATLMNTLWTVQSLLSSLTSLDLTGYRFPASTTVQNESSYDFIIAGAGTAGCILANRLTEDSSINVLLIEAGGDPPLESVLAGLFPYQPNTTYDWNLFSTNDNYSSQYHKNQVTALTAGKMLGGSSSLDHMIYVKGNPQDYNWWAEAAGDDSWGYDGINEYLKKSEKLVDPDLLESTAKDHYGQNGYLELTREYQNMLEPILDAVKELGNELVLDNNGESTLGYSQPIYTINGVRQSSAEAYLSPIKGRENLHVLKNTEVIKILFDGTAASGVLAVTSGGEALTIYSKKEVIVSAGALGSPKLLMLSGIGPKEHLDSFDINVISDLTDVGKNMQDHISIPIIHTLEASNTTASSVDPTQFPVPCFTGYKAMDSSQTYPDYQVISLLFPHDSTSILALCSNVFTYKDEICNTIFNASIGKNILYTVHNIMHPYSRGEVLLSSADYADAVVVHHGIYSNTTDLVNEAAYAADFAALVNTTYFKSIGSEFVQFDLPECADLTTYSTEWWQCYTLQLSATMFHYSGTCKLGSVVDANLLVKGVTKLRVADASVMPNVISGNIKAGIIAIAEKAADIIKQNNDLSLESSTASKTSSNLLSKAVKKVAKTVNGIVSGVNNKVGNVLGLLG